MMERFLMKRLSVLGIFCFVLLAGCGGGEVDVPYDAQDFAQGGDNAPYYNERSAQLMQSSNQYADTDSYRPRTAADAADKDAKWNTSRKETIWREYHGTMIRAEILLGSSELREMRLRLVQNTNGMDIDGDMHGVLDNVAEFEMKRVCGRRSRSYMIVYDRPSFDVQRPTPYFDYQVKDDGANMREYGFKCLYNN
jgi:hypothetical protein